MWVLQKIEVKRLTASLVDEFVTMNRLPQDRELRSRRISFLKDQIQAGAFRTTEWASVHCKDTDEVYRVNGKHTSTLFSQMEELPKIQVVVERYQCETMEEAAQLYATFDSRESARTSHDINFAFSASVPALSGVSSRTIDTCVSGISFALKELAYAGERAVERAERLLSEYSFVLWASQFLSFGGADRKTPLLRAPVAAAMFKTYKKHRDGAQDFWTLVRDESAQVGDATRVLSKFLERSRLKGSYAIKATVVGQREVFVKCLHAWNAWCRKEPTNLKYYADKPTPELLSPTKSSVKKTG